MYRETSATPVFRAEQVSRDNRHKERDARVCASLLLLFLSFPLRTRGFLSKRLSPYRFEGWKMIGNYWDRFEGRRSNFMQPGSFDPE